MRVFVKRLLLPLCLLFIVIFLLSSMKNTTFIFPSENHFVQYVQQLTGKNEHMHEISNRDALPQQDGLPDINDITRTSVDIAQEKETILDDFKHEVASTGRPIAKNPDLTQLYLESVTCLNDSRFQIQEYLRIGFDDNFIADADLRSGLSQENALRTLLMPDCSGEVELIVLVTTSPGNFYNRAAIRLGWGKADSEINKFLHGGKERPYKVIFSVGRYLSYEVEKLIELESDRYKDILRLDYPDSYDNLTNKTVLSIDWIANNCQPRYVLKTDDDCYVNIVELLPWLKRLPPRVKYVGKRNEGMPVIRDPLHRNFVPKEKHEADEYKPYCAGGGYLLSGDVIKPISMKAKEIPQIVNEDAYMGMVAHALKIEPLDDMRFLPFIFTKRGILKRSSCEWKDLFLMHGVIGRKQLVIHWNAVAMKLFPSLCALPIPKL